MKKMYLLLCLLLGFSASVHAGILVEPFVGTVLSGSDEETINNSAREYDRSGLIYGARFGYALPLGFGFGAQYDAGSLDSDSDDRASYGHDEWSTSNLGGFVSYSFPMMFRVWGSYYFNSEIENDNDSEGYDQGDVFSGTGFALGAGWTGLPFLSINLEYRSFEYDEFEDGVDGTTTNLPSSSNSTRESDEILLSLSVPLDF